MAHPTVACGVVYGNLHHTQWTGRPPHSLRRKRVSTRVVITGLGAITPVGNDVETMWQSLIDGPFGRRADHPL